MFSEALKIMDQNTVRYMMDEMQEELSEAKSKLSDIRHELSDTKDELSDAKNELSDTKNELAETESKLINTIISMTKEYSGTREQAAVRLINECGKNETEAKALVEKYW